MNTNSVPRRGESEIFWFQRRTVLQAALAWSAGGGFAAAFAQQRSNVVDLQGDALLNGQRLVRDAVVQTGDRIETGPASSVTFVIGTAAFLVRQSSRITVERGAALNLVSTLRLLAGAVVSVWGAGPRRQISTPLMTVGIRGTGVYTEVFSERNNRSYFCNCYGSVDINSGNETVRSQADYHQSFWAEPQPQQGRLITPAPALNHSDEELEFLARLVNQRTAWQIAGRKGVKDGRGYMDQRPPSAHPANSAR